MREKSKRIRANLVRKLKRELDPPKAWKTIATECGVHIGRLRKWLAYEPARLDNIALLAKALNTTADKIILPDGEEDLTDYVDAEMTVEGNLADLEQPKDILAIIKEVQQKIGPKFRILLMYAGEGSIKIGIKLHFSDAIRLIKAHHNGKLNRMKITSISIRLSQFGDTNKSQWKDDELILGYLTTLKALRFIKKRLRQWHARGLSTTKETVDALEMLVRTIDSIMQTIHYSEVSHTFYRMIQKTLQEKKQIATHGDDRSSL